MMEVKVVSYLNVRVKEINAQLKANMNKAVMLVEGDAKRLAPVDTGRLHASIASRVEGNDKQIEGIVGTNVEYAPFQEFGTHKMAAHPFLFPALESNKNKIVDILKGK